MKYFLILICLSLAYNSSAQGYFTAYFDSNGKKTSKDSSYYYEQGFKIEGRYIGEIKSFYSKNNSLKGKSFYNENGLHGIRQTFYENGNLRSEDNYVNGKRQGKYTSWYNSGVTKQIREYPILEGEFDNTKELSYLIIDHWDSLGNQTIENGNGYLNQSKANKIENNYFDYISEEHYQQIEGEVKNGKRHGEWTGIGHANNKFNELYLDGILQSGRSILPNGKEVSYQKTHKSAEPIKGFQKFYRYVGKNMRYPGDARKHGIEGRVFVQFMIEKDGSITGVKVLKGIYPSCDEEARKVVENSPNWKSGFQRGIPVRIRMILPITFKLS